jgi:transcriptional regulator ATRX
MFKFSKSKSELRSPSQQDIRKQAKSSLEIIDCEAVIVSQESGTNENPIVLDDSDQDNDGKLTKRRLHHVSATSPQRKKSKNEWAPIFPSLRGESSTLSEEIGDNPFYINNEATQKLDEKILMKQSLSQKLMSHQKEAVEFLWKNTMQGILPPRGPIPSGAGCILAHCMGSGKTLSTLAYVITLLTNPLLKTIIDPLTNRPLIYQVLIICPVNVLENWEVEFNKWAPRDCSIHCYKIETNMKKDSRLVVLKAWQRRGGICILGKEMFCSLVEDFGKGKDGSISSQPVDKMKQPFYSCLVTPGPDLVVVDEAHHVKNASGRLYNNLRDLRTQRRISLTGSPLQNNLRELWAMVEFVKSGHFPKWEKFYNLFVRPIEASFSDSSVTNDFSSF